jgi:hypothetical protein
MRPNAVIVSFQGGKVRVLSDNTEFISRTMGDMTEKRTHRASHIYPTNVIKRWSFIVLRKVFGDKGRLASWTRKWKCHWFVSLAPVDGPNLGPFTNRKEAISAEKEWLWEHKGL